MTRITRTVAGASGALALLTGAALLSGCAASSDAASTDTASDASAVWAEADPDVVAALEAAGYGDEPLSIATDLTIGLPWATTQDDGTTPDGLDADLAEALAEVMGADYTLENTSFDSLIPGLVAERYDFSVSAMLDNAVRQEQVDFVDFIIDASGFVVPSDSELTELSTDTVCGLSVGVVRGSVEEMYLTDAQDACGDDPIDLQVFQSLQEGILAVSAGRLDAFCGDKIQNAYLESLPDATLKQSGAPIGEAPVGMALPKDSALVDVVQMALQSLIDDGTYAEILDKWGVADAAVESATINENVS